MDGACSESSTSERRYEWTLRVHYLGIEASSAHTLVCKKDDFLWGGAPPLLQSPSPTLAYWGKELGEDGPFKALLQYVGSYRLDCDPRSIIPQSATESHPIFHMRLDYQYSEFALRPIQNTMQRQREDDDHDDLCILDRAFHLRLLLGAFGLAWKSELLTLSP